MARLPLPRRKLMLHHIQLLDGSNSDSDSCNSDKSQNDMKCDHVEKMEDFPKKEAGRSLQSCIVGASNGNAAKNMWE